MKDIIDQNHIMSMLLDSDYMLYKKIMVTGSSGVLGSAIKAISKDYSKYDFLFLTSKNCDLTDADKTHEIVASYCPDAIMHIAAVSGGIGLSMKKPATMLRDNTLMTFSVLEAARLCSVKKTIMTLTTGMYPSDTPLPIKEEYMHNGYPHESNYGSSFAKRSIDPAIRSYCEEYQMNVIGLIPNGILGENDNFNVQDASLVPTLIRRFYENIDNNEDIVIWGDGSPLREYTYAKDLAKIYFWALQEYNSPQSINIGSTEENSVRTIAYMIADIMEIDKSRIVFDTTKPKGVFRKSTSNERFQLLAHFKYTQFREALENTINWYINTYKNNPDTIKISSKTRD